MAIPGTTPLVVEAPSPGQLRYGLFNAATVTADLEARAIASGFQFPAEDCGQAVQVYDANCETNPTKTFDEGLAYQEAAPYWLYVTRQCGSVGRSAADMEASVTRLFAAGEQTAVESMVWSGGGIANTPALTSLAGVTTVTPAGAGSGAAIAALENAFYQEYGYVGTIHISQSAYANLAYGQLVEQGQGGVRVTPLGSRWAFGAGYGTDGPEGAEADAGSVWAFMTPQVYIRHSATIRPSVRDTMDRTFNQYLALAERTYAHTWACDVVYAVQVPVDSPAVTGAAA